MHGGISDKINLKKLNNLARNKCKSIETHREKDRMNDLLFVNQMFPSKFHQNRKAEEKN